MACLDGASFAVGGGTRSPAERGHNRMILQSQFRVPRSDPVHLQRAPTNAGKELLRGINSGHDCAIGKSRGQPRSMSVIARTTGPRQTTLMYRVTAGSANVHE